ncbi:MAG: hypothetical protein ACTHN8_17565, partial [Angustibacter sp.]
PPTLPRSLLVGGVVFAPPAHHVLRVGPARLRRVAPPDVALSTLGLHAASTGAAADVLGQVFTGALALP